MTCDVSRSINYIRQYFEFEIRVLYKIRSDLKIIMIISMIYL